MIRSWFKKLFFKDGKNPSSSGKVEPPPKQSARIPLEASAEAKSAPHEEPKREPKREPKPEPKPEPERKAKPQRTHRAAPRTPPSTPVIIGLDFGTSSTKVVFRRLGERVAWVMPSIASKKGLAWFCSPPVEVDEKSLKLHILDSTTPPREFGEVESQAVTYLGAILEHAGETVRRHYGVKSFRPIVNIGVPVAYFGDLEVRQSQFRKYEAVCQAALATSTMGGGKGLGPGRSQEETDQIVASGILRSEDSKDSVAVLPESVAALISLTQEPTVEPGIYTVIDIGAGTTEVSTSLYYNSDSGRKVTCYQDCTERIGILDYLQNGNPANKERADSLLYLWWRQFERNWEMARRKDAPSRAARRKWEQTVIMFTGGGGFHPKVRKSFAKRIKADREWRGTMELRNYAPSRQILGPARRFSAAPRDAFHLLAVAHGLSFHRREWPEWYRPDEVETLAGPELEALPYDPQEAGYED